MGSTDMTRDGHAIEPVRAEILKGPIDPQHEVAWPRRALGQRPQLFSHLGALAGLQVEDKLDRRKSTTGVETTKAQLRRLDLRPRSLVSRQLEPQAATS
jgi:hypothetical protein